MKHTPGPWRIDKHAQILGKSNLVGESVLGRVYCGDIFPNDELPECTANAKLIAAAPELLEALRILVGAHKRMCQSIVTHCPKCSTEMEAHAIAYEAIKKATE